MISVPLVTRTASCPFHASAALRAICILAVATMTCTGQSSTPGGHALRGSSELPPARAAHVAVYADSGAWADGIAAFERFLDWKSISHERIMRSDVNAGGLATRFTAIYFPGGYSGDYSSAITAPGARGIRELIDGGGAYIGICAGAYYAAKHIDWEGRIYAGELDLFQGTASGALDAIAPWPGYAMTGITLNDAHPAARFQQPHMTTLYFGGPSFHPDAGVTVDTIATWDQVGNEPAIINFTYGSGRVLLMGPHPEIEENSMRDSSSFGADLADPESDWGLLWSAVDWVLGHPVSDTLSTGIEALPPADPATPLFLQQNYPNPFFATTTIRVTTAVDGARSPLQHAGERNRMSLRIHDILGRVVLDLTGQVRSNGEAVVHRAQLPGPGAYIIHLQSAAGSAARIMTVLE